MNIPQIIPGAEPFFLPGNHTGCLLVHGLTGTPREMRWLGEYLHQQDYTVLALRLPGHATIPADLTRARWQDWLACIEDGLHLLRGCCGQVFLIGISLGAALSLLAAAHLPVDGVAAVSTIYQLPRDWRLKFVRLITQLIPRLEKNPPDWHNLANAKDHLEYPYYPTHAIAELNALLAELRSALPGIRKPVLLVHSRNDRSVQPDNMLKIFNALGTHDRRMIWVENSGHMVLQDTDRQIAFNAIHTFIQNHINQKGAVPTS